MNRDKDLVELYWRYWPIFAGLLIGFYVLWVSFTPESFGSGFFQATLVFTLRVAATYAAVKSFPRIIGEGEQRAWRYFGVGLWIWTISDAVDIVAWGIRGEPWTVPAISDLLHLAGYLAFLTGCATYPLAQPGRFGRIREALEVSILAISVLSISWLIYLSPSIATRTFPINILLWLTISPVMDLILMVLGLRLILLHGERSTRLALSLFTFGFIVLFVSDMASSYSQVVARATIPSLTQAGWMGAATLFGLAFQRMAVISQETDEATGTPRPHAWIRRIEPLIPIAFTYSVIGYVFFDWWFSGELDWLALAGAGALIVLLFARQGVIAGQREMGQFAALVNSTSDMAFIVDQDGHVRMANPAFYSTLGARTESLDQLTLSTFIRTVDGSEIKMLRDQAQELGWSGEVMLETHDGESIPILLSLSPVTQDQPGTQMLAGTAHDLSPIRQREDELRQAFEEVHQARSDLEHLNEELEDKVSARTRELAETVEDLERLNRELKELDHLKSEFVALVSHELRAPMTNIRGGIELLLDKYPEIQGAPKKSLALVQAEVQRLSGFVETVLDLSALEAGKFPIELAPVEIEDVLNLVLDRFPEENRSKVEIIDSSRGESFTVKADPNAIESVFFHLLDNGFKYAADNGLTIVLESDEGGMLCKVQDSGSGIPEEEQGRVFDMFHRLDTRDSREIYGYGLGLPMVKRLLTAMGGWIEAHDLDEGGTEMRFWIPLIQEGEEEHLQVGA